MNVDRTMVRGLALATVLAFGAAGCAMFSDTPRSASTGAYAEPRGPIQTTADAGITAKVKTALAADELVKARNIDVDTVRGVVALNGTVSSMAEKDRAISLARNVQGVVEVKDNLRTSG
jgi:osmotically-inducible protein OsmY